MKRLSLRERTYASVLIKSGFADPTLLAHVVFTLLCLVRLLLGIAEVSVSVSRPGSRRVDVCTRETEGPSLWTLFVVCNRKIVFATGTNAVSCTSLLFSNVAEGLVALLSRAPMDKNMAMIGALMSACARSPECSIDRTRHGH